MKILHITPSYLPATIYGGPTFSVSRLCESLVSAGSQVRVLTTTANGKNELDVLTGQSQPVHGVEVFYYPRLTKDHTHFSPQLLRQVWKQCRRFDAVHIHSWWNLVAVLSFLVCRIRGVRPIVSPRGMLSPYSKGAGRSLLKSAVFFLTKRQLERGAFLHYTSTQEREKSMVKARSFIAPNIVELPDFRPSPENARAEFHLCFLGRIDPVKGLEWLFRSLPRLAFPWHLEIVGDGQKDYLQSLKTLGSQLEIEKRISWAGWLSEGPKFDKIRSADLIVLLSRHENFANVVLESLAVGTPVLLSDQVGLSDYVLENDLGWVTPLDQEKIAQTLETAFLDTEKRRRIREQAPGIIRRDFDAGRVAEGYLGAYMEVSKPSFHGKKK